MNPMNIQYLIALIFPVLCASSCASSVSQTVFYSRSKRPNIVFIVADDLGWNDVSWHNPRMPTPHLSKLRDNHTITLNQYYVVYVCTPSRTSFLTGYYPFHAGLQHHTIDGKQPNYLPGRFKLLPEYLKPLGYKTHAIGKWHLGFCRWDKTPTYRGFDKFYGFYNGQSDYFKHEYQNNSTVGLDFRDDKNIVRDQNGTYSAFSFTKRAVEIIENHTTNNEPFYMYLAYQNIHTPLQVPQEYVDDTIVNKVRRIGTAMIRVLDDAVGNITKALENTGQMDNTIIVFTTDNGANVEDAGNNWPLRGSKVTPWEGGTRGIGLVHYNKLETYEYNGLFHAVDWLPTLIHAAGGQAPTTTIDGVNQWDNLISNSQHSSRNEFVYNIDELENIAAIRVGDYKLLVGGTGYINRNGWYPPLDVLTSEEGRKALKTADSFGNLVMKTTGTGDKMLFDLRNDPYEREDISGENPDIVRELYERLQYYNSTRVEARFPDDVEAADPSHWHGVWSPGWC